MDREIKHRISPRTLRIIIGASAATAALAFVIFALAKMGESSYSADYNSLTFGEVTEGQFREYLRLNGRVESGSIVQVSALESGIVEKKWVEEGAVVKPGDHILTLHNPLLRQQILDSESQLAEKQNMLRDTELAMEKDRLEVRRQLLEARTNLTRMRRAREQQQALYDEDLTSREEYLRACEDYELASESYQLLRDRLSRDSAYRAVQIAMMRESLDNMRENFALVRSRADNLDIRATHEGQLGSLSAEIGQSIASGSVIGQINILDRYKIATEIDEHYIDRVSAGVRGIVERGGKSYPITVAKVYPEVTAGKFRADMTIDGELPENIRVGQTYYLTLETGTDRGDAILIPRGTFYQSSAGKYVYVVDPDGHSARRREVTLNRQNPDFYEVVSGLAPGERIITSSYRDYGEADKIVF